MFRLLYVRVLKSFFHPIRLFHENSRIKWTKKDFETTTFM